MDKSRDDDHDMPMGRITFDDLGNAVWQPFTAIRSEHTLNRVLETDKLTIAESDRTRNAKPVRAEEGYNPYGSGMVVRDGEPRRKKDLRALSEWVKLKKRLDAEK
jgi:hypothetical protein